jgi:predicted Zn-dependent peptidase
VLVDRKGAVQSALFVAQPFPRRLEPGHEARLALNDIIGGLFTSRLNMNLRERHAYTYGAHSTVIANRNFGLFAVQTSVRTDATAAALGELLSELVTTASNQPPKGLSAEELVKARADLINRLGAHLEQNRHLTTDTENIFVQGLAPNYLSIASNAYASLRLQDLAAQTRLLTPGSMTIVIVGDRASVQGPLAKAGFSIVEPDPSWTD